MRTRITLECTECKQRNYNMTKDKKTLAKQTVAVTVCSVILGAVIAVVDVVVKYGIDFLVK